MNELKVGSSETEKTIMEGNADGVDLSMRLNELQERRERVKTIGEDDPSRQVEQFKINREEAKILMESKIAGEIIDNQEVINNAIAENGGDVNNVAENSVIVDAVAKDTAMQESVLSPGDAVRVWRENYYKAVNTANEKGAVDSPKKEDEEGVDMSYVQMADGSLYENNKTEKTAEESVDMSYVQMADGTLYNSVEQSNDERVESNAGHPEITNFASTSEKSEETKSSDRYEWNDIVRPLDGEVDDNGTGGGGNYGGNNGNGGSGGGGNNGGGNEGGPDSGDPLPERSGRLSESEYAFKVEKWKEMIDGTHKAVENVEKIVQKRRSSIFWRLKNLGLKNVTTLLRLKIRKSFSNLKEKTKNLFGFGKKKVYEGIAETPLSQEYFPQPGENLSTIIKEQVLGVPEMSTLTQEQKDTIVQNLFTYAKKNPYMSMFDQVNKFSDAESVPTDKAIDLQMIKRLINFPVDEFGNKTIIEYSKNPS
jgi:uncharacterized membrane protein YgcG